MAGLHAGCLVAAGVCALGFLGALALPGAPPPEAPEAVAPTPALELIELP